MKRLVGKRRWRARSKAACRPRPLSAKRHGRRRESAALEVKQARSPDLKSFIA